MAVPPARLLEQRSHIVGKLCITEHLFQVPRDYSSPASSSTLQLFARSARKHVNPVEPPDPGSDKGKDQLPWLLYLQGGPGMECSPPEQHPFTSSFLDKGYQVLFLDQRGTGLSTPVCPSTLGSRGDDQVQARYLQSFRADSIARDAEAIRQALTDTFPAHKKRWSLLGQSFGGFVAITYLSLHPGSLREVFLTGGLPPIHLTSPDEVYRRLFPRIIERNRIFYQKYPEDVGRVKRICKFLGRFGEGVRLPGEGVMTVRRFLGMGIGLGFTGGVDGLHNAILRVHTDLSQAGHLTRQTLNMLDHALPYDNNPLYAILHEPLYCQGEASDWSAWRVMAEFAEFDVDAALASPSNPDSPEGGDERPLYFTGETVFPHLFTSFAALRAMRNPAEMLARHAEWPRLYDLEQLRERNDVPVYAAVYLDDMYVDYGLSVQTARGIRGCRWFVTSLAKHDGLRRREEEVFGGLWALREEGLD